MTKDLTTFSKLDVDGSVDESGPSPAQDAARTSALVERRDGRGARFENRNSMRHGMRSNRLPRGCSYVARITNEFRQSLENAVTDLRGEITLADAAAINTALRWERHAQLSARWLAVESEAMTADQRLACSRDVARASESRDRAIRSLGLEPGKEPDIWQAIHSPPQQLPPPEQES